MIRLVVLTITLALAMSACIDFSGLPGSGTTPQVTLSASHSVADIGEQVDFTADFDTGSARIWIVETEVEAEPSQIVRTLPILGSSATITVQDATTATLSVPLAPGRSTVLGREAYRFDQGSRTYLAYGGSRSTLTASTPISIRAEEQEFVRDGIQSATFSTVRTGSTDEPALETIAIGETRTISLDGESAVLEILDYTMVEGELSQLTLRARYQIPILGEQVQDLDFDFSTGKRINLATKGSFDIFLREVSYSVVPIGTAQVLLVSGTTEVPLVIGQPVMIGSRVVLPLELSSGSALSVTALLDPDVFVLENSAVTFFPNEAIDVTFVRTADRISFTDASGTDQIFSTYTLEAVGNRVRVTDAYAATRVSSSAKSVAYSFRIPGDYTARVSVTDGGEVVGEADASVLIR